MLVLSTVALVAAAPALAQPRTYGPEFQVNTYTTGAQWDPSVAMTGAGQFVVVWHSNASSGSDVDGWDILGQRYAADGSPRGDEFQVNSYTTGPHFDPAVAVSDSGTFVVVWTGRGGDSLYRTFGRRFAANGSPLGTDFQINTYTTDWQFLPVAAMDGAGNFVVVWENEGSDGSDTSDYSVQGRRYDANGDPIGSQFQVNDYTTDDQSHPSLAMDSVGNFVVVWQSSGSSGSDTDFESIWGRRFDSDGNPLGTEFQVNSYTTGDQVRPSTAMDSAGNFVVVWISSGSSGSDPDVSIQGQRYDSTGSPLGSQFQVNAYTTNSQEMPAVAMSSAGQFVVAWQSDGSNYGDTSLKSIQGQRYDANGNPLGSQFQVNTYSIDDQKVASVAMDSAGNWVAVWDSDDPSGSDSIDSIQGQLYDALFRDGWESGDVCRWSSSVGGPGCA